MKNVSVSELKAQLSRYLREVKRGGEIQVMDRGIPIARLTPLPNAGGGGDEDRRRLIEAGILTPGTGDAREILDRPPLELPGGWLEALDEDREDRF